MPQNIMWVLRVVIRLDHLKFASYKLWNMYIGKQGAQRVIYRYLQFGI